ncbi:MAG: branched-chain amino acid ABC transporter substrate-binding protein [Acetobacteraceae bacterium]
MKSTRRRAFLHGAGATLAIAAVGMVSGGNGAKAAVAKEVAIGLISTLNGPNANDGKLQLDGALMAIEEANAAGGVAGYKITPIILNDYTTTAGDYDPAQAAQDVRQLLSNPKVVAVVGPKTSDSAKAMEPLLSEGDLACIGPSGTNPDLTDPRLAGTYRPRGKVVYFRTVATDAYQAPGMADFLAEKLKVTSAFVVDDGTAFGVGVGKEFETEAARKGIKIFGTDRINPREADYTVVLTKIKAKEPQALYFAGDVEAGVKLAKEAYNVIPNVIKAGTDALLGGSFLKAVGFPAANGWYVTVAAPSLLGEPGAVPWVQRFTKRFGVQPFDYSLTAYDASLVALDAIGRIAKSGKPVDRHTVRDAVASTNLRTLQGQIAFDANGDLTEKVISLYHAQYDPAYPVDDALHQFHYIGVAP